MLHGSDHCKTSVACDAVCVGGTPEDAITSIRLGFRSHAGLQDGAGKRHIAVRDTSGEDLSADAV